MCPSTGRFGWVTPFLGEIGSAGAPFGVDHRMSPERILKRFPAVGRLQLFKLVAVESNWCVHCARSRTSKSWATLDGDWEKRLCNGCYGEVRENPRHAYLRSAPEA